MQPIEVKSVKQDERERALNTLLLGFSSDPVARWMIPDPKSYLEQAKPFFSAFGGDSLSLGNTYASGNFEGVAVWLAPGQHPDVDTMVEIIQRSCDEAKIPDVLAVFEAMAGYHPELPCWYLPLIGVDPVHQGLGFGAGLMKHALRVIDEQSGVAYLESSNPRNISLYERHGFERLGEIRIGSSPVVTPMLREPR